MENRKACPTPVGTDRAWLLGTADFVICPHRALLAVFSSASSEMQQDFELNRQRTGQKQRQTPERTDRGHKGEDNCDVVRHECSKTSRAKQTPPVAQTNMPIYHRCLSINMFRSSPSIKRLSANLFRARKDASHDSEINEKRLASVRMGRESQGM
jgi:hypothetical protein